MGDERDRARRPDPAAPASPPRRVPIRVEHDLERRTVRVLAFAATADRVPRGPPRCELVAATVAAPDGAWTKPVVKAIWSATAEDPPRPGLRVVRP